MTAHDHGTMISDKVISRLVDKDYRDSFVESRVRNLIAYQIKALRDHRGLSQAEFGNLLGGKPQSAVSRLEDPDYGRMGVSTLLEVATACDVALIVRFANYPDFLAAMSDVSPEGLMVASYSPVTLMSEVGRRPTRGQVVAMNAGSTSNVVHLFPTASDQRSFVSASGTESATLITTAAMTGRRAHG